MSAELEQAAADVRAAADLLERDGWTRHDFVNDAGCRCIDGALVGVLGGDTSPIQLTPEMSVRRMFALGLLHQQLVGAPGLLSRSVHTWNDEVCTSQEQAVEALRRAADAVVPR